jgi:anaerobic selenocysteine-containing dehydrogenase
MTAPNVVRTMCPTNCHPTFCGMLVEVEGGGLKTVSGDKDNPDSQGFLCVRGRSTNEIFGNPRRLLYPQIRDDRRTDSWRRVSWDEALDFIVKRMRAVGLERVGLWAGHGGFTPGSAVTVQMMNRFSNIYGCKNWHPAMICWGLGVWGDGQCYWGRAARRGLHSRWMGRAQSPHVWRRSAGRRRSHSIFALSQIVMSVGGRFRWRMCNLTGAAASPSLLATASY